MMNDEQVVETEVPTPTEAAPDYVDIVKSLKANTVAKDEYDALRAENVKLLRTLAEGRQETAPVAREPAPDLDKLRHDLYSEDSDLTNLKYVESTLKLREALMNSGEPDPFLPIGHQIRPTADDIACAENVAKVFQHCIDYANGDSEVFTNELQRLTVDSGFGTRVRSR